VAQDADPRFLRHLATSEGRSSLKTWIFRIVLNAARTRAAREHRAMPFSATAAAWAEGAEPAVEPQRFRGPDDQWPGGWVSFRPSWGEAPEQRLLAGEVRQLLGEAIDQLPPAQREVVVLRGVHGWSAEEVCQVLEVSDANQRVLLHRGRSKLRRGLVHYLAGE
jgi:RNA polymerase sigma-70 factor, ECF subfamily